MPIAPKLLELQIYCRDCGTYLEAKWDHVNASHEIEVEPCQCPLNEIREIYEGFKNKPHKLQGYTLWEAIKAACEPPEIAVETCQCPLAVCVPPEPEPTQASTDKDCYVP